ncbi:MAG: hypothetical protein MJ211_15855 [Bacteroidales bacterium]|nr:hypothetical protein [Bacteroidales bacterium]
MKKTKLLLCLVTSVSLLAGCGGSESPAVPSDWQFDRETAANFEFVQSEILTTDQEDIQILRVSNADLLNDVQILNDDFFVFNYDKLIKEEISDDYYTYNDYKKNSVEVLKEEINSEKNTIDIYFKGHQEIVYGAIFNKDATYGETDNFVYTIPELNALDNSNEINTDNFEKRLLASPDPGEDDTGYIDLINHFGQLCSNIPQEGENLFLIDDGILLAILGIALTCGNWMWSGMTGGNFDNFIHFNEIELRLSDIDAKLNKISSELRGGFSALLLEADKTAIRDMTTAIANFKTNFVQKINDFSRILADDFASMFRKTCLEDHKYDYSLIYDKTPEGKYYVRSRLSKNTTAPAHKLTGTVGVTNSLEYLRKTDNRIDEGFTKEFFKDIKASINESLCPPGRTVENVGTDIFGFIVEDFIQRVFSDIGNKDRAQNFRNLIINYIEQLYETDLAIVSTYVNRCKLSYNFAGEAQRIFQNNLAYLMLNLEKNAAFVQMVCRFTKGDGKVEELDLKDKYLKARKFIKQTYEDVKSLPSNYCFRDGQKWSTKFFSLVDDVPGPQYEKRKSFTHNLKTYEITPAKSYYRFGNKTEYNRGEHPWANPISIKAVTARFGAQKASGILNKDIDLLRYLRSVPGLLSSDANRMLPAYQTEYGNSEPNSNVVRIFADISKRAVGPNEKGAPIQVVAQGDKPNRPLFHLGDQLGYKQSDNKKVLDQYWKNAVFYTSDLVDVDGVYRDQVDLFMCCDYLQSDPAWRNDEIWAFSGYWRYYSGYDYKWHTSREFFGLGIEVSK